MTPRQSRMARAALDWQRFDLANRAGISASMLVRFETGAYVKPAVIEAVERVLRARGVEFMDAYDGVQVRLEAPAPCPRAMAVPSLDRPAGGPAPAPELPPLSVPVRAG